MDESRLNDFFKTGSREAFDAFAVSSKDWIEKRIRYSEKNFKGQLNFWAEELTQEVHLKLLKCYGTPAAFDPEDRALEAWLGTVINNTCVDFLRKKSTKTAIKSTSLGFNASDDDEAVGDTIPDTVANEAEAELEAAAEAKAKLESLLSGVPELTKKVVVMSKLEGRTYAEIMQKTGLSKPKISRMITGFIKSAGKQA